jgi:hypothetical protein
MPIELTAEQSRAIGRLGAGAAPVHDPRTRRAYLLVSKDFFRRATRPQLKGVDDVTETYAAQVESALRAGWDDPKMAAYDDYDAHRKA